MASRGNIRKAKFFSKDNCILQVMSKARCTILLSSPNQRSFSMLVIIYAQVAEIIICNVSIDISVCIN